MCNLIIEKLNLMNTISKIIFIKIIMLINDKFSMILLIIRFNVLLSYVVKLTLKVTIFHS